jgi:hypothetical protein
VAGSVIGKVISFEKIEKKLVFQKFFQLVRSQKTQLLGGLID